MHQVSQIAEIIEKTIEEMTWDPDELSAPSSEIAQVAAKRLVQASLEQLATLLGTNLEANEDGATVLNLGQLL